MVRFAFVILFSALLAGSVFADTQIYSSQYATWYVSNSVVYTQNAPMINQAISTLDAAIPQIQSDFGYTFSLPVQVHITTGGCCGGYSSPGAVGLNIGDFSSNIGCQGTQFSNLNWTEGVVVGEFVNAETGVVTVGWPKDWWVDGVWYFPGMVVVQSLNQAGLTQLAGVWQQNAGSNCGSYTSVAGYNMFRDMVATYGWVPFRNAFSAMETDGMHLNLLTAPSAYSSPVPDPSDEVSEYTVAYLSLTNSAIASYMVNELNSLGLAYSVNTNNVTAIINTRNEIYAAKSKGGNVAAALQSFDAGNYNLAMAQAKAANTTTTTSTTTTVATTTMIPTTTVRTTTVNATTSTTLNTTSLSTTSLNTTSSSSTSTTSTSSTSLTTTINSYSGTVTVSSGKKVVLPAVAATTFTLYSTATANQSVPVSLVNELESKLPSSLSRSVLISAYNISVPSGAHVIVDAMSAYPCGLNASRVAPYKLVNGNWTPITPFTVNSVSCEIYYSVPPDPLVGIFELVPQLTTTPTSTIAGTTTIQQQGSQAGQQSTMVGYAAAAAVMVLIVIYAALRFRPREPKISTPAPSKPWQGIPSQLDDAQQGTF